jgi:hypothetical protein
MSVVPVVFLVLVAFVAFVVFVGVLGVVVVASSRLMAPLSPPRTLHVHRIFLNLPFS